MMTKDNPYAHLSKGRYAILLGDWRLLNTLDRNLASHATAKGHKHKHGKVWLPRKGQVTDTVKKRRAGRPSNG